ncbi:MAG: tetratricopeptide repeat protein [Candidatus Hydrogenedentes bacterium]|nr:tetratricopeptide repeat protein [Candidatus Hydrogenedentota bacterium]
MTMLCVVLLSFGADAYEDFRARGDAAYMGGDFATAISAYETLADSGVGNPELYFNLGNAYYHGGDLGRAVLNYERAASLGPEFSPARRNLERVIQETANKRSRPDGFSLAGLGPSRLPGLSQAALRKGLLAIWWLMWSILIVRTRKSSTSRTASAAFWIVTTLCVAGWAIPGPPIQSAVVVSEEAPMRYGPDASDAVRATLAAGDRVLIDQVYGSWARVEIASGERGWLDRGALALAGPPFSRSETEREQPPQ